MLSLLGKIRKRQCEKLDEIKRRVTILHERYRQAPTGNLTHIRDF